ncbi:hypothetical protein HZC27_02825 [Candidatus Roizmanbacteria bacterium]|nr:hypothetical protein [Candidatus Roizmanbacteria bacterium]
MNKKIRIIVFFIAFLSIAFTLAKILNPLDPRMFNFHDDTQAARIQQMTVNLKSGHIPPRLAPTLSYGLGFPVFNFYAPFSYQITTGFHLLGMSIPMALKFSFFLSVVLSFVTMFLLLQTFFGFLPSILGGVAYSSSLWFAVEIFVRGNLAECWFLVLFPLALYVLIMNSRKQSKYLMAFSVFIVAFTLTVHNVFSLLALVILTAFILLFKNKKRNFLILALGLLLSSYFLVPAISELSLTYAAQNAQRTHYEDHFLCANQIWSSPKWEFSGSTAGCENDGMPFTLGKIHIILGALGIAVFLFDVFKNKTKKFSSEQTSLYVLVLTIVSLFLTTYQSSFIWTVLSPVLSLFQFPWRFLLFGAFGLAYFIAYLFNRIELKNYRVAGVLTIITICLLIFTSVKFFSKPWLMSYDEYASAYMSENYISRTVAYNMAEYLPKTANYDYWRSFDSQIHPGKDLLVGVTQNAPIETQDVSSLKIIKNDPFSKTVSINKSSTIKINIHYFPFWEIKINGDKMIPDKFDSLGRPIIILSQSSTITVIYKETLLETISNIISLIVLIMTGALIFYKPLWNKLKPLLK